MERVDEIMEQVQTFASTWALVDSRFDDGTMYDDAMFEKAELEKMIINLMKENK